ncbi:LL-diaminopimelate aminotransferase [Effusibacillus dendaii]|uniref:Aminotransferase n=1 Tax=Effusibacillus dendaii TaxID=2743772 RepID=A0A7I8DGR2_9BACL|nr:LL-diaminopimelate aminotransferase [Effusibacillus dendaii]BCJ88066.1 aminotransferase [Effusibacillus dendaii]
MNMQVSRRLERFSSAMFFELNQLKQQLRANGTEVIDLGIGSPDLPPPPHVIEALTEAVCDPSVYGYPTSEGSPFFRQAVADWYKKRFDVELDPSTECMALMGSQDGLSHLSLTLVDPGDYVLVPDPGYPIYEVSIHLADGRPYLMPLLETNDFLPDFSKIPPEVAQRAKYMILNYPNNPVTAVAERSFYEQAVSFAKLYDILIVSDIAYSELAFDGFKPISILQIDGAKDVAVEFHSLSKSFNMAGCRIGYAAGNREALQALAVVKSNIDYGVFTAVQKAGAAALTGDPSHTAHMSETYRKRRDVLLDGLKRIGWDIPKPQATMFVWAKIPIPMTSRKFTKELLAQTGVAVVPGVGFGEQGEGYVRIALVQPEEKLQEVVARIEKSGILKKN